MISSVRRACNILSCFTQDQPVLGNAEIAERLGLSRSTTHHLITTLCEEGVLIKEAGRKYRLGWKLIEWNNSVMFQQDFYNIAMPLVSGLTKRFCGTAHIGMIDHNDVVCVLRISSTESDTVQTYLGSRTPAYSLSIGKVLLAYNEGYLQETINKGLLRQGPNTITDINKLKIELERIRKQGYSVSEDEYGTCTYEIAAPIKSYSGKVIASVNLFGSTNYIKEHRNSIIESVVNIANAISRELGYIVVKSKNGA